MNTHETIRSSSPFDYSRLCREHGVRFCQGVETGLRQSSGEVRLSGKQTQLFNNRINDNQLRVITEILSGMQEERMEFLDFSSNEITDVGLQYLVDLTSKRTKIAGIDLTANNLSKESYLYIRQIVSNLKGLKTLLLGRNPIGDNAMSEILLSLVSSNVTSLDISNTDINNKAFVALKQLLERGNIKALKLANIKVLTSDNSFAISRLCEGLSKSPSLKALDISSISLGDDGLEGVLNAISKCSQTVRSYPTPTTNAGNTVTTNKYSGNDFEVDFDSTRSLKSKSIGDPSEPGATCSSLEYLCLKSDGLSSKAGELLSKFIVSEAGSKLTTVVLDGNRLGSKGASYIAHAITTVHRGMKVSIRRNCIKAQGLVALALASRASEHPLERLYVEGNARYMGEGLPGVNEWEDKDENGSWNAADEWERTFLELGRRKEHVFTDFNFKRNSFGERQFCREEVLDLDYEFHQLM